MYVDTQGGHQACGGNVPEEIFIHDEYLFSSVAGCKEFLRTSLHQGLRHHQRNQQAGERRETSNRAIALPPMPRDSEDNDFVGFLRPASQLAHGAPVSAFQDRFGFDAPRIHATPADPDLAVL